jgi:hypothetical protein
MTTKKPRNVLTTYIDPVHNVTVTVYKPTKTPKSKMTCKNSRGFVSGNSGFANGFPRAVAAFKKG